MGRTASRRKRETRPGFAARVRRWQQRHGRHDLPWQGTRDPYRIWLSEIMLQQTQVATVIPYYERFLACFPDAKALARAPLDEVLRLWSGLGYYTRARNLHRAAQEIVVRHGGEFPRSVAAVQALPGIGRSTAAAICAFAFGERQAILDGNVKRVFARFFGIRGYPGERSVEQALWRKAEAALPRRGIESYTQGLMDLGATVCTRAPPRCTACPLSADCIALAHGLTRELPHPRPRKALPERSTTMLVLLNAGEVLLEKRPAAGIWGGMWSLPEIDSATNPVRFCTQRLGVEVDGGRELPPVAHGFTHFRLHITPRCHRVRQVTHCAAAPGLLWLPTADALGAAIPAPVRVILKIAAGVKA